jgi:ABC-type phosphate transport system substrate-binding protein
MKKLLFFKLFLLIVLSLSVNVSAQVTNSQAISIKGAKFAYPLIQKWIDEYKKVNPAANIVLSTSEKTTANINLIANKPSTEEINSNQYIAYVGRYALLPVANSKNRLLVDFKSKTLNRNEIQSLIFKDDGFSENTSKVSKLKYPITFYSRDNQAPSSIELASYFGYTVTDLKGKKVLGEDFHIISAVKKDSAAIAYANLAYIYDFNTKKLKDGITLLQTSTKAYVQDGINPSNVDKTIAYLESNSVESVPVEQIGFVYDNKNKTVVAFVQWILSEGQRYNHDYGFLVLDNISIEGQKEQLNNLLSLK